MHKNILTVPFCLATALLTSPVMAQSCPAPQPLTNMALTFDDEFMQGTTLSPNKWTTVAMGGADSINREQEAYVPSAVQVLPGGGLRLQASQTPFWTNNYTSGEVSTYGHFAQAYGHFEMKAKLPDGNGLWPAFWLLSDNGQWPPEIDVLEYIYTNGKAPGAYQTLHWGSNKALGFEAKADYGDTFHTYAIDWRPGSMVFLIDGVVQNCMIDTPATGQRVPTNPMYMIANLAIGAQNSWSGSVTGATQFPANMDIAYIRAYQFNDVAPVPQEPILIVNPQVSQATAHVGDTVTLSVDVTIGNNDIPGTTQTQFFVGNYDHSINYSTLAQSGPAIYKAHQTYHYSVPYKVTAATAPGIYTVQVGAFYNKWAAHEWFSQTGFPPFTVLPNETPQVAAAARTCGLTPSGQTTWVNGAPGTSSVDATVAECPYGGVVTTTWLNQAQQLCTNGVLTTTGQTQQINTVAKNVCKAPLACGAVASGKVTNVMVKNGYGTTPATTAQCPKGGTVETFANYYQPYLCTNGVLSPQGTLVVQARVLAVPPVCNK